MLKSAPKGDPVKTADALVRAGKLQDALEILDSARAADPGNADIVLGLARVARRLSMPEAASRCAAAALELAPDSIEAVVERSIALRALRRHDEASDMLRLRISQTPEKAELWLALANTVREQGLLSAAEAFLREALRLNPGSAEGRANLADILFERGEVGPARELYDQAIKRAPRHAQMRLNRALILLHAGDLKAGWRDYEWRLEIDERRIDRHFTGKAPVRWDGSDRRGRALLILAEQGLGDQILFSSLIPELLERGDGPLIIECEPRLVSLFERSFRPAQVHSYQAISEGGHTRIDYDWLASAPPLMIEIGSLPRLLKNNLDNVPEFFAPLAPDPEAIEAWRRWLLSLGQGPKIGLCWRSGKVGSLRDLQYAPPERWRDFVGATGATFIMCQYSHTSEEVAALEASGRPVHIPPGLDQKHEIDRLAALLSNLDALVSAPTTVASLAAAVGTPTLKLTYSGSWTAFGRAREPFLPAAQIVTPSAAGDWVQVFAQAQTELARLLAG